MASPPPFPCPCCGFPTIGERASYDICTICWWEDDGQDGGENDPRADEVWGGPNGRYSLSAARANFEDHSHMYDAGHGIAVVENPTAERMALLDYAQAVRGGETLDLDRLQALIARDREARKEAE